MVIYPEVGTFNFLLRPSEIKPVLLKDWER